MKTQMALLSIAAFLRVPERADSAQDNYAAFCAKCHGADGHRDRPSAASLGTKAQDFADCAAMQKVSDDTMFNAIKGGGASVGLPADMPGWSDGLSDAEIHDLVGFIHTFLGKKIGAPVRSAKNPRRGFASAPPLVGVK
jgi:mono/diheme cytochrome c family protein